MAKSKSNEITIDVKVDPAGLVALFESIREHHVEQIQNLDKFIAKYKGESGPQDEAQIYIIDAAAIPAAYYLRESVQAAIKAEIAKDYQLGQELPAGASLTNQVEARHGKTDQISGPEDDNAERGTGSEDPESSKDHGGSAGSSDPDPSRPRG